jgi:cytochrome c oxidase subunit 2
MSDYFRGFFRNIPLMPEQASTFAHDVDILFFVLVALTLVFTLIVAVMIFVLSIRYRRGAKVDRSRPVDHSLPLELSWSLIPLALGLAIFVWGAKLFAEVRQPPPNAMEIFVVGKRWMWHLQHANGIRENNELHVPVDEDVKLTMISQDVVHDFFVPEFRIHQDVIPGFYTTSWFHATKPGKYHIFCAQFCGTNHSQMTGYVYVLSKRDYQSWLNSGGNKVTTERQTMAQLGAELFDRYDCGSCHGPVNTVRGPSLFGIYNAPRRLTTGQTVKADDQYLRRALVEPDADVVEGYQKIMPDYKDLKEDEILQLIAYMKSLGTGGPLPAGQYEGGAQQGTGGSASNGSKPTAQPVSAGNTGQGAPAAGAERSTTQGVNNGSNNR